MKVLLISAIADAASAIQAAEWRSSASTSSSAASPVQSHSYPASSSHGRQQPKKVFAMMKANLKRFDFQGYCQRPLAALVGHLSKEPTMCSNLSELKWTIRDQGNLSETSWSLDYNPIHLSRCTYKPNYVKQPLWTLRRSEIKGTSLNQSELSVIIVDQLVPL